MTGMAGILAKPDAKKQVLHVVSSMSRTHKFLKLEYATLVENKPPKVSPFEDRLPLPTDTGITGPGIRSVVEAIILCD
jgi:hypothetical protein